MLNINNIIKDAYMKWKDRDYIYEKKDGIYVPTTYGDFIKKTIVLANKLLSFGLKDKRIIIYGCNSCNYMISDLAILAYVGVSVNVSEQTPIKELEEVIKKMEISAIMYDIKKKPIIDELKLKFNDIKFICMQDIIVDVNDDITFEFKDKKVDECSKIVFSNGTTSNPKGIMLSLKNIFAGYEPLKRRAPFDETDVDYLFLPLHHTYGNIYNFLYSLLFGFSIYLCSGIENIDKELKEVNPTIFCAVPLIYARIYKNNINSLETAFGNRIKYLFCGGAKFDVNIRKMYKDCGLPMMEAYALTETASSFSIQYKNDNDFESVGTIFENIDVKIINKDADGVGDIVVKGDNVFIGYANNENLTKESFTDDGYFITGDYGYIIDNKLYLKGRKDNIIVMQNGEKVYPIEIENKLKSYSSDIVSVKVFLRDNKLTCNVYIKENSNVCVEDIINSYNTEVVKKDKIADFEVLTQKQLNFKEI